MGTRLHPGTCTCYNGKPDPACPAWFDVIDGKFRYEVEADVYEQAQSEAVRQAMRNARAETPPIP